MTNKKQYLLLNFINYLISVVPRYLTKISIQKNEVTLFVPSKHLYNLCTFLKLHNKTKFYQIVDMCGIDYLDREYRFEVVYNFLSLTYNYRLRIKVDTNEFLSIPSLSTLFPGALWLEREVWDTYGIFFSNHPDLRRLLTDYGFEGYPFRKDFPQIGFFEVRYDDEKKHVLYEPVELAQEFRLFNFSSPWIQVK